MGNGCLTKRSLNTGCSKLQEAINFKTMVFLHLMVKTSNWFLFASRELSLSLDHFEKRTSSVSMDPGYSFEYHQASWRISKKKSPYKLWWFIVVIVTR